MATFSAIKNLGSAIIADIAGAAGAVGDAAARAKHERKLVKEFKANLRNPKPKAAAKPRKATTKK